MFVQGPYLVRSAEINGNTLALTGDLDAPTNITIWTARDVEAMTWNGKAMNTKRLVAGTHGGIVSPSLPTIVLPELAGWKSMDNLPEKNPNYDYSGTAWKIANDTTTPLPTQPFTLPVLYVDQYGFHVGTSLFRTNITGNPTSITLGLQGGTAFGFSVFLNSVQIGAYLGNSSAEAYNMTISIQPAMLQAENTLLIIMDNTGHDERSGALNPRGILLADITGGAFGIWKIAGSAGGEMNLDPIRGPLSEGGLTSERLGWALPGFDDSAWTSVSPSTGMSGAGVTFYRTTANLSIPTGLDVSIIFTLNVPGNSTSNSRSILWINGYLYGLFNPYIGHQVDFPVPTGILNYNGENTIALSVWNQDDGLAAVNVGWTSTYVHETGYDFGFDAGALRPGWTDNRLIYA